MTKKISYKLTLKSEELSNINTGLAFGNSAYNPEIAPVLQVREVNPTNFIDGIVNAYDVNETDRHVELSSNYLIKQGRLVKNKISGICLNGEKSAQFLDEIKYLGDYRQFANGKTNTYATRIHEDSYDIQDGSVEAFVFRRKRGRISIYKSALPYELNYVNNVQDNFLYTFKHNDYNYAMVHLDTVNIMKLNGLTYDAKFTKPSDFINSFVQFGIKQADAIDACDNIRLRDFGIVPEQDPEYIRVGTTFFPIDTSSNIMIGIRFGAGIKFLSSSEYEINGSTGTISIHKDIIANAYSNLDISFNTKRTEVQKRWVKSSDPLAPFPGGSWQDVTVEVDTSIVNSNENANSVYSIVAFYDIAPAVYFGMQSEVVDKMEAVDHNDKVVLLDVDTYDTTVSNFTLSDKRMMMHTGTWDSTNKVFSVQQDHSFFRVPAKNKTMFAEQDVPIVINGHRIYDKKRYVFKSSVLNSLWCRPSMDIFDLTIPVKLSDFVVTDLGNGVSKYEFTQNENIVPESATLLGEFTNGILPRLSIGADVNRPMTKSLLDPNLYQSRIETEGQALWAEGVDLLPNINWLYPYQKEQDVQDSQGAQFKYMDNDNKAKDLQGNLQQGVYKTRKWTISQFYLSGDQIAIDQKDIDSMILSDSKISFSFNTQKTGNKIILPSWPDVDSIELYKTVRRYSPDGSYTDYDEVFDEWKIVDPDIIILNPSLHLTDVTFRIKYNHAIFPKIFCVDVMNKKFAFYVKNNVPLATRYPSLKQMRVAISRAGTVKFGYINAAGATVYVPEKLEFETIFTPDYLRFLTLKYKEVLW